MSISLVVVDQQEMLRLAIRQIVMNSEDIELVGSFASFTELMLNRNKYLEEDV